MFDAGIFHSAIVIKEQIESLSTVEIQRNINLGSVIASPTGVYSAKVNPSEKLILSPNSLEISVVVTIDGQSYSGIFYFANKSFTFILF